jgi:hypothetical protein
MNETHCTDKTILEKYVDRYLEIPPSKARMTVRRVPQQKRESGA